MSNPNLLTATGAAGTVSYLTPGGTTALVLIRNAASSNTILKINQIVAANVSGSAAANATVSIYTNGGQSPGSAPSGGTAYPVISAVSVPTNASLIAVDKTTGIYLMEDQSISVTSGTASAITYTISYEIISGPA
jgi:hypothetical protein